jgi:hypothetical protein
LTLHKYKNVCETTKSTSALVGELFLLLSLVHLRVASARCK